METLIIHTEKDKLQQIKDFLNTLKVPFEISKEVAETKSPYDPAFVAKIQRSSQQAKEGKGRIIKIEDLWK